MFVYIIVSYLSLYMFGSDLYPNILDNIDEYQGETTAIIISCVFLVVIGTHIPFIFFPGKLLFFDILNELLYRSISKLIEHRIMNSGSTTASSTEEYPLTPGKVNEEQNVPEELEKKLPDLVQFIITNVLYVILIVLAIFIDDVSLIFEFVGAIATSMLSFVIPGLYYLVAERKFTSMVEQSGNVKLAVRISAYSFIVIGFVVFVVLIVDDII